MSLFNFPWLEVAILAPLLGALPMRFVRRTETAWAVSLTLTGLALLAGAIAWAGVLLGEAPPEWSLSQKLLGRDLFTLDRLSGPLLPLVALLHFLTILTTARVKMNRMSFTAHMIGESVRLATFACADPWPLISLLAVGSMLPVFELIWRGQPIRLFLLHMLLFVSLLVIGWLGQTTGAVWSPVVLLLAVMVRSGTFAMHLWIGDLFRHASFGTALLFATPLTGVYATLRLVIPVAPEWVLQWIGIASQVTVVYAAGLALVQTDARRWFACLFLSNSALVLIGLEVHTPASMAGALGLWVSVSVALTGLGLTLRALEARHGRLLLKDFRGYYEQAPTLAVGFALMGLACVGFPGTLGFVALEVLVDGVLEANPSVGVVVVLATTLNSIGIVRAYLLLFTGKRTGSAMPMPATQRELGAVLILAAIIVGGGLAPQALLADRREVAGRLASLHQRTSPDHTGPTHGNSPKPLPPHE